MKFFTREVKIGIMVVIAIFALFFGVNYLKGFNIFIPSNSFYTQYSNLDGLAKSAPVIIKGYKVGQVSDIIFDFSKKEPFTVVVSLDNDLKIPIGSKLELSDDGLIGGKCIVITLKDTTAYYSPGDTIRSQITVGLMQNLAEDFIPKVQGLVPQIDTLLGSARSVLENEDINEAIFALKNSAQSLEKLTADLNKIIASDAPVIVGNLKGITSNLSETSLALNNANIDKTLNKLDNTIVEFNTFSKKLNNDSGTLGLLLNDESLYRDLNSTVESANLLLIDIKEKPKRYVHFSVFGKSDKSDKKEK